MTPVIQSEAKNLLTQASWIPHSVRNDISISGLPGATSLLLTQPSGQDDPVAGRSSIRFNSYPARSLEVDLR